MIAERGGSVDRENVWLCGGKDGGERCGKTCRLEWFLDEAVEWGPGMDGR